MKYVFFIYRQLRFSKWYNWKEVCRIKITHAYCQCCWKGENLGVGICEELRMKDRTQHFRKDETCMDGILGTDFW